MKSHQKLKNFNDVKHNINHIKVSIAYINLLKTHKVGFLNRKIASSHSTLLNVTSNSNASGSIAHIGLRDAWWWIIACSKSSLRTGTACDTAIGPWGPN